MNVIEDGASRLVKLLVSTTACIRRAHQGEDAEDYRMVAQADEDLAELEGPMVAAGYLPEQVVRWAYELLYPQDGEALSVTAE